MSVCLVVCVIACHACAFLYVCTCVGVSLFVRQSVSHYLCMSVRLYVCAFEHSYVCMPVRLYVGV